MLQRFKDFISSPLISSPPVVVVAPTADENIIAKFSAYMQDMFANVNFPKRAQDSLKTILKTLQEMDFEVIDLQDLALVRRVVQTEIPQMIELYLSLPHAHAVSYILENGKTSKDTLIEKLIEYSKKISSIADKAVEDKTKMLVQKQKRAVEHLAKKVDFFDL